jgi:nucleotide-binding universal stress UspA family protein
MSSVPVDVLDVRHDPHEFIPTDVARRRILCATDLASRSDSAMQRAALLAEQMGADVRFVHVVSDRQPSRIAHQKANRARVRLKLRAEELMEHDPQAASVEIHSGKPLDVLAEVAAEWNADLIVLAAPTPRRHERLLGTTAERIIRAVHCPVLLVNRASESPYRKIAVATDLSPIAAQIAHTLNGMGLLNDAYAWFVHGSQAAFQGFIEDEKRPSQLELHKRQWQKGVNAELMLQLAGAGLDLARVRVRVECSPPLDAIQRLMAQVNPQLLVIGTSRWFLLKRLLFGSVAHGLLRSANCDVLAISARAARREAREPSVQMTEEHPPVVLNS